MNEKQPENRKSDFFSDVYEVVKLIPMGRVTSFGAIASYLGSKQGARMVGWALGHSHTIQDIPAHRVLNRNGVLTGKHQFSSPTQMQASLEAEGVTVKNDKVVNFMEIFWDPNVEL